MASNLCGLSFDETFNIIQIDLSDERVRKRRKNKRSIELWDKNKQANQEKLLSDLQNGTYKMSKYRVVDVMLEKPRTLAILPHRDRIFQDLMLRSMKTYFDKVFIDHSYACIVGKGTTKCIRDIQKLLKTDEKNTKYYIQLDIKKFFPSVNGEILKQLIRKVIFNKNLLKYHDMLIDSYEGLPIGNSTSQYYANFFISYMLHKLYSKFNNHKIYVFVYMDDMIIFCENKKYLVDIRDFISDELSFLDLRLKNPNAQVYVTRKNGIRFLGYVLYGTHTLIRRNVINNCWELVNKFCAGKISKEEFKRSYSSYTGMFKIANTRGLCFKLYNYILERTGEHFYFNNWDGKTVKISQMKGKKVRIIDITSFNKYLRIDFVYKGESCRLSTTSKKLSKNICKKRKIYNNRPFNYIFR